MPSEALTVTYDKAADVLYIVTPANAPAVSKEEEIGMVWRYDAERGSLVGLTLIEFQGYWTEHINDVAAQMSERFGVTKRYAKSVLESIH